MFHLVIDAKGERKSNGREEIPDERVVDDSLRQYNRLLESTFFVEDVVYFLYQ